MKRASQKALVLGLGNLLSGDDSFGVRVLDALNRSLPPPRSIVTADAGTDLLNYIEEFASYERVLLIDAILDPEGKLGEPGSVLALEEVEFSSWPVTSPGIHQITPMLGVKLFHALHPEAETKMILVGLVVDRITHEIRYATDELIEKAAAAIREML